MGMCGQMVFCLVVRVAVKISAPAKNVSRVASTEPLRRCQQRKSGIAVKISASKIVGPAPFLFHSSPLLSLSSLSPCGRQPHSQPPRRPTFERTRGGGAGGRASSAGRRRSRLFWCLFFCLGSFHEMPRFSSSRVALADVAYVEAASVDLMG